MCFRALAVCVFPLFAWWTPSYSSEPFIVNPMIPKLTRIKKTTNQRRSWLFNKFYLSGTKENNVENIHAGSISGGVKGLTLALFHNQLLNPLTPKIWLLILPSSYYTFPCRLITRIRCSIKVINCTWWVWVFSLPVCCVMYGYYREKLQVNHFWELRG